MDTITARQRSILMGKVRSKNTAPELAVRRALRRAGIRFRMHRRNLPGRPDIILLEFKTAIFVHGCFWHRHANCRKTTTPASNRSFWLAKFRANRIRDRKASAALRLLGWSVVIIWECETRSADALTSKLTSLDIATNQ